MVGRIWRGWTTAANADAYERLLREETFPGIAARGVAGYRGIRLLRRPVEAGRVRREVVTQMPNRAPVRLWAARSLTSTKGDLLMRRKGLVLLFILFLASLPMSAHSEPGAALADCRSVPAQSEGTADLMEGLDPAQEVGLFTPEPQRKGCFMDCMNAWTSTMCAGLSGTEYQQCVNDGAEGCRCSCQGCL